MAQPQVKFYYRNVFDDVIGSDDGISESDFKRLEQQTAPVLKKVNQQRKTGETPYRELPYDEKSAEQVKKLGEQLKGDCENFVVLGIGGSALGNIALQTALNPYMYNIDSNQRKTPRILVFDNVDPQQFGSFLDFIGDKLDKTVFNVISKSGRTAETASQFLTVRKLLLDKLGEEGLKKQVITTTDAKEGTLRKITDSTGFRSLQVPDGVGGRFSVLSHVGLLSAYMGGIDIDGLLEGARDMDKRVSSEDFFANPAAVNAAVNYYYYNHGKRNSVMFAYSYALKDLADWYRQLWAESLGKSENLKGQKVNIGPTPIKALGTTDQHSQVQLYREGPNDKLFTFLEVEDFERKVTIGDAPQEAPELSYLAGADMGKLINSEKKATEFALIKNKRPCLTVSFEKVTPYTIGQFIYLFEVTTSITGELFGINTYNQPAVELGKEATFALMGRDGYGELAARITPVLERDGKYLI